MGQFLKQTFASLVGSLAALLLLLALGTSGLALFVVSSFLKDDGVTVENKTVLVYDLSTPIKDTPPLPSLGEALGGGSSDITLRQVLESLERATEDERIVGLFLDGSLAEGDNGYAVLSEFREALKRFRAAGKTIIAYDTNWEEKNYYLSSVADTVVLTPMGTMTINGFSSEPLFLAGALDKYGIGVQIVRAGNYKSAIEPFTRQSLSPESREQTEELLGDLWGEFIAEVAESRELSPQKLQQVADTQGFLNPEEARTLGLVDRVAYLDQVVDDFKELTEVTDADKSFRQLDFQEYLSTSEESAEESENKIAVAYIEGAIVGGEGTLGQVGSDRMTKVLAQLRRDEAVKAVVLRINTPGGSALASDIIGRQVELLSEEKPVVVSMGNVAASGGYWIATLADYIFAQANTITGSIGVFGQLPNVQEIANENGITWDVVKTGRFADFETVVRPKTEQELAILQNFVNQTYNTFVEKVAQSRNLSKQEVDRIAQGRVWSGQDAQEIGLVDRLGGLEAAISYAAEQAELGDNWEIEEYPQQQRFDKILERLIGIRTSEPTEQLDALTAEFLKLKEDLSIFQDLNDPKGIYTRMPFNLHIE